MGQDARTYRFGDLTFYSATGELEGPGLSARLAPQPALVLRLLLDEAGSLVTREYLQERVWPDTIVEFDKNLNFCIREVRAALGEEAASPTFIETLPRRGYRFMLPVESGQACPPGPEEVNATPTGPSGANPRKAGDGSPEVHGSHGSHGSAERAGARGRRWLWIAAAVAGLTILGAALARPGASAYEPDSRALEAGEMGGFLLNRAQGDDVRRSVGFFRDAVALDPDYAKAFWGLGSAYLRLGRVEEGRAALHRSLELDPDQWRAHLTLGLRALYTEYEPERAGDHFRSAVAAAPEVVSVRHSYAWFRAVTGDLEGAVEHMRAALALDPVSPRVNGDVGRLFYLAGRHDEAVAHCGRTRELTPEALRPRDCMVQALVQKGALDEARDVAARTVKQRQAPAEVVRRVEAGDPRGGLDAYWRWAGRAIHDLADQGRDSHVHAAAAWARIGDADRAFEALEAAYEVRCPVLPQIELDPAFASIRSDARFASLLRRIGAAPSDEQDPR